MSTDHRNSHQWKQLRDAILSEARTNRTPCMICGQAINYRTRNYNAPDAPTVDHVLSWRDYPELRLDRGNLTLAHRACNTAKGVKPRALPASGNASRNWGTRA